MQKATFQRKYMLQDLEGYKIEIFSRSTSANSVFAVRFAHPNGFILQVGGGKIVNYIG
jgi:hypothetical protein